MKRASVPALRQAMAMAKNLARAGIEFVPMPVLTDIDRQKLVEDSKTRLGKLYDRPVPE